MNKGISTYDIYVCSIYVMQSITNLVKSVSHLYTGNYIIYFKYTL